MLNRVEVHAFEPLLDDFVVRIRIDATKTTEDIKMLFRSQVGPQIVVLFTYAHQAADRAGIVLD